MDKDVTYYWIRRLHSLTGLVPTGLFLLQHIYGNVLSQWGAEHFNEHVHFLIYQPLLYALEAAIFVPLAFHMIFGLLYTFNSKMNPISYRYQKNWTYTLQRVTGIVVGVFIILHLAGTRFAFSDAEKHFMHEAMSNSVATQPWLIGVYIVGVAAAAFHLCNGIWSFCIMWGITITRKSQDLVFKGMMGLMVLLIVGGAFAILGFSGVKAENRIIPSNKVWEAHKETFKEMAKAPTSAWYLENGITEDGKDFLPAEADDANKG
ncbi:MAG: succinate dehydrogenase [Planctomycetes bacterium]|nr:succinate dehydrogenase [Planctomycetota bacterium]